MENVEMGKIIYRPDTKEEAENMTNAQLADTLEDDIRHMCEGDIYLLPFVEIVKRLRVSHECPRRYTGYFSEEIIPSMAG